MKVVREQSFKVLTLFSIFLTICGLCLLIFSVCSSAWQIVYLRELHVYHQHGVWWDCIQQQQQNKFYASSRILRRRSAVSLFPESKCSHKFDSAAQSALDSAIADGDVSARELQLHRILPSCSGLADLIFLLAASRINVRYVPGIVDIYEQHLGVAVLAHGAGSLILFLSFFISLISSCILLSYSSSRTKRRYCTEDYCHYRSPELRSFQKVSDDINVHSIHEMLADFLASGLVQKSHNRLLTTTTIIGFRNSMDVTVNSDQCESLHPEAEELGRDNASAVSLL
uniref:Transmembrane protein n=1 Tax=Syphacia muris TaxID=451379 RepID=A0A0N5AXF7_9BILA